MALKPMLKVKVDELFMRWVADLSTQTALRTGLQQILRGEPTVPLLRAPGGSNANQNANSRLVSKPQSPRPKSPSTPPCSPSTAKLGVNNMPISPRRSTSSNSKIRHGHQQDGVRASDKEVIMVCLPLYILLRVLLGLHLNLYSL